MTVADTNVRPAWRPPAVSARGTRRFGLARLLLKRLGGLLRKLDLKFLLLLAVAPTPACIIPVGPEWQDPLGSPNAPPQIFVLNPEPDTVAVTATPTNPFNFRIVVTDVNVTDSLEIKWLIDGDDTPHATPKVPANGTQQRTLSEKTVNCASDIDDKSLPSHLVKAVVADRGFVEGSKPPIVSNSGLSTDIKWILNMTCPQ
jgi:hypothetical protein